MQTINFEKLTKRAIAIYTEERRAIIAGDETALQTCTNLKNTLLAELDKLERYLAKQPDTLQSQRSHTKMDSLQAIIARRTSENTQLSRISNTDDT